METAKVLAGSLSPEHTDPEHGSLPTTDRTSTSSEEIESKRLIDFVSDAWTRLCDERHKNRKSTFESNKEKLAGLLGRHQCFQQGLKKKVVEPIPRQAVASNEPIADFQSHKRQRVEDGQGCEEGVDGGDEQPSDPVEKEAAEQGPDRDACSSVGSQGPVVSKESRDQSQIVQKDINGRSGAKMAYERGNRHLAQLWGKVQPRRKSVKFRIGNDKKVEMPVVIMPRLEGYPCYRSWTTLTKNMCKEDDPVLRALPYFGDHDDGRLDYLERGYKHILAETQSGSQVDAQLDAHKAAMKQLLVETLSRFGIEKETVAELRRLLNCIEEEEQHNGWAGNPPRLYAQEEHLMEEDDVGLGAGMGFSASAGALQGDGGEGSSHGAMKGEGTRDGGKGKPGKKKQWRQHWGWTEEEVLEEFEAAKPQPAKDKGGEAREEDTYRALFCRRCFRYDCHAHGTSHPLPGLQGRPTWCKPVDPTVDTAQTGWADREPIQGRDRKLLDDIVKVCGNDFRAAAALSGGRWSGMRIKEEMDLAGTLAELHAHAQRVQAQGAGEREEGQAKAERPRYNARYERGEEAKVTIHRRQKLQRARMNTQTYRRRGHLTGLQPEYSPCDCGLAGRPCVAGSCSCVDAGNFCEKFCGCHADCSNRFPGCQCRSEHRRCRTSACPCSAANRECDPDLCLCGAHAARHAHKPSVAGLAAEGDGKPPCCNMNLLTQSHARLRMGISDVSGWGLFTSEDLEKDDFVYEYMGEVISHEEADRRGSIYDKWHHSFLFNLNNNTVVDATLKGNKTRFANHSNNPNCYCKIMLVNGEHRIGVYAKTMIKCGVELFYDYRHDLAYDIGISAVPDWLLQ